MSIEINSLCNRQCRFCPNADTRRPVVFLEEDLFKKIISDLKAMRFSGDLGFTHFNEPLLDKRLPALVRYAHTELPCARLYLNTNGDLLTFKLWQELRDAGLQYANVSQYDGVIRPQLQELLDSLDVEEHACLNVHIFDESKLNNRAGLLHIEKDTLLPLPLFCERPFYQLCITYRGTAALCCNDYFCAVELGDLRKKSVEEIWHSPVLNTYRLKLLCQDRSTLGLCKTCTIYAH